MRWILCFVFALVFIGTFGLRGGNAQEPAGKIAPENEAYLAELKGTETASIDIFCDAHNQTYLEDLEKLGVKVLTFKGGVAHAEITGDKVKEIVNFQWVNWIGVIKEAAQLPSDQPVQEELGTGTVMADLLNVPLPIEYKFLDENRGLLNLPANKPLKLGIICNQPADHGKELAEMGVEVVKITEDWIIIKTLAGKLKEIASLQWVLLILPAE